MAKLNSPKLMSISTKVATVGPGREKPLESFMDVAQPTSSRPATNTANQAETGAPFPHRMSSPSRDRQRSGRLSGHRTAPYSLAANPSPCPPGHDSARAAQLARAAKSVL